MPTETFFRLRDEKQESIMRAAMHEFVESGFERAKVSDIAKRAGVAKGSIYQYFSDKEELYIYCAEWGLSVFMEKLDKRMELGNLDVFEYFMDSVSKSVVLQEERELTLFMQSIAKEPKLIGKSLQRMYSTSGSYITTLLQNSKAKGTVRIDLDDELLTEYFIAVTERFKTRWMNKYIDFSKESTEEQTLAMQSELTQMLELLKNGMGC